MATVTFGNDIDPKVYRNLVPQQRVEHDVATTVEYFERQRLRETKLYAETKKSITKCIPLQSPSSIRSIISPKIGSSETQTITSLFML